MVSASVIFWVSVGFIVYTYFAYPLLLFVVARLHRLVPADPGQIGKWPTVAVVVPIYNERGNIARKIATLRSLEYSSGRLRFVFVSDGSTDGSEDLLAREPDVTLVTQNQRTGKPGAINTAMGEIHDDVVMFTDARQEIDPKALKYLVASLLIPGVGAVSGELVLRDALTGVGRHVGLYWRYEKWIRQQESRIFATAGVTGALYVIRRRDFEPLPADTLLDDFEVPIRLLRRRQRALFDTRAQVYDNPQKNSAGERKRKVRTLTGNFQSFARNPWLFNPLRNPVFIQFLSHKVFRLLVPYALVATYVSNWWLEGSFYTTSLVAQSIFYAGGLAGMGLPALRQQRLLSVIVVFLELNLAAVLALRNFLMQRIEVRWEKT
jgi:cellulose synthase/poly-beta-1,6-N-acetylglucosamine synthase-like glycosyltransferase